MASSSVAASSAASPYLEWKYDVFLSFRGETRYNFTAHLHDKLTIQGITRTFLDEVELEKGKPVNELFTAIEKSRFAIIVISPNYASSKWCMNELLKILECMEVRGALLPIFYSVEPSDVGKQSGIFGKAFTELEQRFKDEKEMVEQWRAALRKVSKINGWTSKDRHEPQIIKEIVEKVRAGVRPVWSDSREKLVGMDSRLEELDLLLDLRSDDIRFIGIWGMGGIGKTTIAIRVHERILHCFDVSCFLDRVRECCKTDGLVNLQRKLCESLTNTSIKYWNIHEEAAMINYISQKKVLLILDDVDDRNQLTELCRNQSWFGPGSRVIITTRDEKLLIGHGVERRFEVQELNEDDSLQLFSWHAFTKDRPDENYLDLSRCFVNYANGLPLALKVLGSFLVKSDQTAWSSALGKLTDGSFLKGDDLDSKIMETLKISYDGLDDKGKSIFLDIACFFKGKCKDQVVEILDACGFHPAFGINVLIKKSLVTVSDNVVRMHDLLEAMGQAIVIQHSKEPGNRSRLWLFEDISNVLTYNMGTATVEGIVLDSLESNEIKCHRKAFSKMFNLRLLKIHNVRLPQGLKRLPNSLRFLEWSGYPLKSLPLDFEPIELVELSMCHSSIEQLWNGIKKSEKLKVIKLNHCKSLIRTPDFEGITNLERLELEACESLVEIHPSTGLLKKLNFLNLKDCKSLVILPEEIKMECLEILVLSGCSRLKKIPKFVGPMEHLWNLSLDGTAIESIPSSVEHLTSLSSLDLQDCLNLNGLPSTIGKLQALKCLNVSGCSKLAQQWGIWGMRGTAKRWPSSFGLLKNLESFLFRGPKRPSQQSWYMSLLFRLLPLKSFQPMSSFLPPLSGLTSLRELDLSDGNLWEGAIPNDIGCLSCLVSLNLSGNNFDTLPTSIGLLSKLENLYLSRCRMLQHLPVLSSDINLEVTADDCTKLEMLQCPSNLDRLNLSCFNFINCFRMLDDERYNRMAVTMLEKYLKGASYAGDRYEIVIPGSKIPRWFSHQRMGASISVGVSPDWNNNKWLGYALCAVFQVFRSGWELSCVLEVNGKEEYPAPLLSTDVQPVSDHIWLFYVSRDISFGTEWQRNCSQLIFSFKSSGHCLVKRCGARLLDQQDVDEFNQIMIQSG